MQHNGRNWKVTLVLKTDSDMVESTKTSRLLMLPRGPLAGARQDVQVIVKLQTISRSVSQIDDEYSHIAYRKKSKEAGDFLRNGYQ